MIPIFFSIDDNYAPFLSVTLCSMIQNASKKYSYRIIILYKKLSRKNQLMLSELAGGNFEIQFVPMGNRLNSITNRIENCLRADYFTLTIYFRLFIPVMFPEYDKAIYLDSDTVVLGDISELYRSRLDNQLLAAVTDYSIIDVPPLAKYIQFGVGLDKYHYINSGVLLMNLDRLRKIHFERQFLELMNTYHFDCLAPDQDYLNVICRGQIRYLPANWNTMPADSRQMIPDPQIIHYNLFTKPWHYENVTYQEYFWQYAKDSAFYPQILDIKKQYTEKQRQLDRKHMELLLLRGRLIAEAKVNFHTVFNGRKEIYL